MAAQDAKGIVLVLPHSPTFGFCLPRSTTTVHGETKRLCFEAVAANIIDAIRAFVKTACRVEESHPVPVHGLHCGGLIFGCLSTASGCCCVLVFDSARHDPSFLSSIYLLDAKNVSCSTQGVSVNSTMEISALFLGCAKNPWHCRPKAIDSHCPEPLTSLRAKKRYR